MPSVELPVELVADVQDALLIVVNDLNRLDGLLTHAMNNLMVRFETAHQHVAKAEMGIPGTLRSVQGELQAVITELQFQDMASQLINHTSRILQGCAYKLAAESMDREEGEALPFVDAVPERPNPVTQDEMHAGSVELF
jgi:hypothetical protein